jgi:hypothetical protein
MKTIVLAMIYALSVSPPTFAAVACASSGEVGLADPALAPKIIAWATRVEQRVGLVAANYRGPPIEYAKSPEQAEAAKIQILAGKWESEVRPGTMDAIFRQAVAHGANAQYEAVMMSVDPHNSNHEYFMNVEAARANACLSVYQRNG